MKEKEREKGKKNRSNGSAHLHDASIFKPSFPSSSLYHFHISRTRLTSPSTYTCTFCSTGFASSCELLAHMFSLNTLSSSSSPSSPSLSSSPSLCIYSKKYAKLYHQFALYCLTYTLSKHSVNLIIGKADESREERATNLTVQLTSSSSPLHSPSSLSITIPSTPPRSPSLASIGSTTYGGMAGGVQIGGGDTYHDVTRPSLPGVVRRKWLESLLLKGGLEDHRIESVLAAMHGEVSPDPAASSLPSSLSHSQFMPSISVMSYAGSDLSNEEVETFEGGLFYNCFLFGIFGVCVWGVCAYLSLSASLSVYVRVRASLALYICLSLSLCLSLCISLFLVCVPLSLSHPTT